MKNLGASDLQILVSATEDLHADFDPKSLPERAMKAVSKVVKADSVAFTGIGYNGKLSGLLWDSSEAISPEAVEIFGQYIHEQPLFATYLIERSTKTLKITDLMAAEKFERTNIYNEFYRRLGVRNQLVSPLSISADLFVSCSINTCRKDFPDRDKLALSLLAPHLVNAIRNAFAYQRLDFALETEACGIVSINSKGKPVFVSEFARQLFDSYFTGEKRGADLLPETISSWLKETNPAIRTDEFVMPPPPLKIAGQKGELVVRRAYNKTMREVTLLLEEKRFSSPKMFESLQLTRREAEILFWVTQGKSDEVIATLCGISLRTVHKHVENIYTKLGVETRTGAMLRALEIL